MTIDGVPGSEPRVVVYSRIGCSLCDDALATVAQVCDPLGVGWVRIDVDGDAVLEQRYGHYVPAILVDGVQQGFWRIDGERLEMLLSLPAR